MEVVLQGGAAFSANFRGAPVHHVARAAFTTGHHFVSELPARIGVRDLI